MNRIYLDNCCFNRPYDDQESKVIRLESEAKMMIQTLNPNKNHTDYLTLKSLKIIKQEIYKNSKDRLVRETL
jgi:hypothetical protein